MPYITHYHLSCLDLKTLTKHRTQPTTDIILNDEARHDSAGTERAAIATNWSVEPRSDRSSNSSAGPQAGPQAG